MNQAVKDFLHYPKRDWMIGQDGIKAFQEKVEYIQEIARMIEMAERRYDFRYQWGLHEGARRARAASIRLRKHLTNKINELSL